MNYPDFLESFVNDFRSPSPLRSILFDSVTGLPTLPMVMESLKNVASQQSKLGIIFVDTTRLEALEEEHGWELLDTLLNQVRVYLDSIVSRFSPLRLFSIHRVCGDDFILVLSSSDAQKPVTFPHVDQVASSLDLLLNDYLTSRVPQSALPFARIFSGYAILEYNTNLRFERLLSRSINKAFQMAVGQQLKARETQVQELQAIVDTNQIRVLFQPIVELRNPLNVLGHEALSRGPEGTLFETADLMFSLAAECGIVTRLENLCQSQIISVLNEQAWNRMIFVNLEPSMLEQDHYHALALFQSKNIQPQNIVLEITERVAIHDYDVVSRALEHIRALGFRIAVDDVGSGYASLQSIACLKPDFIKVTQQIVNGIARDFIKQEIVRTLGDMAGRFSATLIAEGIDNEADLRSLLALNVPYGQGYFLQRPLERLLA